MASKEQKKHPLARFSWPFLLCVSCVYFAQGFKSVGLNALSFFLKDELKMDPSAQQVLLSTAHIPWSIKPIYGLLSDYFPIFGLKRKPYIILAAALGVIGWLLLAFLAYDTDSISSWLVLVLCTATNLSTAMSDVVVDAMVAEQSNVADSRKEEEEEVEGVLQSLCWQAMAVGGLLGAILGGQAATYLQPYQTFLFTASCPCLVLASGLLVTDKKSEATTAAKGKSQTSKLALVVGEVWKVFGVFVSPHIFWPMSYLFFSSAVAPSLSTPMFFFLTDTLAFGQAFISYMAVPLWGLMLVGTYLYQKYFSSKSTNYHRLFGSLQLATAVCTLLNMTLVLRWNLAVGIPDAAYMLGIDSVEVVVQRLMLMPMLVISAKLCPQGSEGTLFALFMSLQNFSHTVSAWGGALLSTWLGIVNDDLSQLYLGLGVRALLQLMPLLVLRSWLPATIEHLNKKETGSSSSSEQSQTQPSKKDD